MPLNSSQLAELVSRARHKAVTTPPPPPSPAARPMRSPHAAPVSPAPSAAPSPRSNGPTLTPAAPATRALLPQPEKPAPLPAGPATPDDSPWFLDKSSWRFHRRFYTVFRRPMQRGEYSSLLKQIRFGHGQHLSENYWRVTLPGSSRGFAVVATPWRLITILPKDWQPPSLPE